MNGIRNLSNNSIGSECSASIMVYVVSIDRLSILHHQHHRLPHTGHPAARFPGLYYINP